MKGLLVLFIFALLIVLIDAQKGTLSKKLPLTKQQKHWVDSGSRSDLNGWIWVQIKGDPYPRGFTYGYMIAKEFADAWRVYEAMTLSSYGMTLDFFNQLGANLHRSKIPAEYTQELQGVADGLAKAGIQNITLDDIIGFNDNMEITGYYWPTIQAQYGVAKPPGKFAKAHCSGFVATGNATKDGRIVIGHESFTEFWNGQYFNVILDITPTNGYRMVMQTSPGWIASMTDFWLNSAGILVVETTIAGYFGYSTQGIPEWIRVRNATQYGNSIDQWVAIMENGNNGGYANSWLLGDTKTNEIAEYEQGLKYQSLVKKTSGYLFGDNVANDPRIRNLECVDTGYSDTRQQTGARRTRWPQLLNGYYGQINATVGQTMLGDTYDPYLKKINPSSRCICSHYDVDPQYYASDPNAVWNVPFYPAGSVDGKITTAAAAANMSMWGIFGRADGVAFDADSFLASNSQYDWQQGYLASRPSQPWTYFSGN
eukprot:TRINITY_DN136_c0_g1_i2.p1 TRINITY_DN136_c0_g1~~TRINITY_DN136_c0_g1_i2.p1  ORF type:complete len:483 (-),score=115.52 TRINITY_DN136_c0_g1_i2:30-1478(-)